MDIRQRTVEDTWVRLLLELRRSVPYRDFEAWLWPLEPELGEAGELRIVFPFPLFRTVVEKRYGEKLATLSGGTIPGRVGTCLGTTVLHEKNWRRVFRAMESKQGLNHDSVSESKPVSTDPSVRESFDVDSSDLEFIPAVMRLVADAFGLTEVELMSSVRKPYILWPRQATAYLARRLSGMSYPKLAEAFGQRNDHTTIMLSLIHI